MAGEVHDGFLTRSTYSQFGNKNMPSIVQPPFDVCPLPNVCPCRFQSCDGLRWVKLGQFSEGEEVPLRFNPRKGQLELFTVFF